MVNVRLPFLSMAPDSLKLSWSIPNELPAKKGSESGAPGLWAPGIEPTILNSYSFVFLLKVTFPTGGLGSILIPASTAADSTPKADTATTLTLPPTGI